MFKHLVGPRLLNSLGLSSSSARRNRKARRARRSPLFGEWLEPRQLLHGGGPEPHDHGPDYAITDHVHFQLDIFVNKQHQQIPVNIGGGGTLHTHEAGGLLHFDGVPADSGASFPTIGDFFDVWRTNAGAAGNNPNAIFNQNQILSSSVSDTHTVRMFVNGVPNHDFENYVLREDDAIVISYEEKTNTNTVSLLTFDTVLGSFQVELFPTATPLTVDNFLTYVNAGDYTDSIVHRSAKRNNNEGFVIQGGGFAHNNTSNTIERVPQDPPVMNEPGIQNTRGTISMAKLGGDENSATNQWFISLSDNRDILDGQNGGFTVFGRVIGDGMSIVDAIAALPTRNLRFNFGLPVEVAGAFEETPVRNFSGTTVERDELMLVNSVTALGEIRGSVFFDANADGAKNAGEQPLAGWTIFLDANNNGALDAGETTTTSDAGGNYRFTGLSGDIYVVREVVQPGWDRTLPANGALTVTLASGQILTGRDFGNSVKAPTTFDLLAESDTGIEDDDDFTRLNNSASAELKFSLAGLIDGATVEIFANNVLIGQATASGATLTVTTNGTTVIPDGIVNFTAKQTFMGVTSAASAPVLGAVDTELPVFTSTPGLEAVAGTEYTYDADATDNGGDQFEFSLVTFPEGMTIVAATGVISWTATNAQEGDNPVVVRVKDLVGNQAADQSFTVNVNRPPVAMDDDGGETDEDTAIMVAAPGVLDNDSEPDGDTLTITAFDAMSVNGAAVTVNADGSFTYDPSGSNVLGTLNDGDEVFDTFTYTISDSRGGTATGTVTVRVTGVDGDPLPTLSIDDVMMSEGDTGTTAFEFTVSLSHASLQIVTAAIDSIDGAAIGGVDFAALSEFLTFLPGETTKAVTVLVNGEDVFEADEDFTLELSLPVGAALDKAQGVGTIENDDAEPTITIGDVQMNEGNDNTTKFMFAVTLSNASSKTITVEYATADDTAMAGTDYTTASGTVSFAPGETTKMIEVTVLGNTVDNINRDFFVNLENPTDATLADAQAVGTILDDDLAGTITISDVTVVEGDSGTVEATFTLTLSGVGVTPVTVDFATADGTAVEPADYVEKSGKVTFAPGETTKTIVIIVQGDASDEIDEDFLVNLSNPLNATIGVAQAKATITDDDDPPTISIADVSVNEGDSGTVNATVTVTLSVASGKSITVDFATDDDTAVAGTDYQSTTGTLTFAPGETTKTISVPITPNTLNQSDREFFVDLTNATNATLADASAEVTITDDDPAGTVQFSVAGFTVEERTGVATITITRSGGDASGVAVTFTTRDRTATAGADYTSTTTTVTFGAGETSKTVAIPIAVDSILEDDEVVDLILSNVTGGGTLGARATAVLTILDSVSDPNERFIVQSYRDLLGREAEPAGMAFYRDLINQGAMNNFTVAQAIQNSPEFRTKMINDLYSGLLGRAPDAGGMQAHLRFLDAGGTFDRLRATILASEEYFQRNGGSNEAWLTAVYRDVLGRALDATGNSEFGRMLRRGASRSFVVRQILGSDEAHASRVRQLYDTFLDRDASEAEVAFHVNELRRNVREEAVTAGFAASDEYFARL